MSFFQPHHRQEGFHLPSPPSPPQYPYPNANNSGSNRIDFSDDLSSLVAESEYRASQTHNIFDISAPASSHAYALQHNNSNQHQSPLDPYPPAPNHFNSTLPALNSSLRFEPPHQEETPALPPPSSWRHTPSPHDGSRSRSRDSTSGAGPVRNSRRKHSSSISSTSPPPMQRRPSAIVIPGSNLGRAGSINNNAGTSPLVHSLGGTAGWMIPGSSSHSMAAEYSLPTPESLTRPHSFSSPFSLHSPSISLPSPHISSSAHHQANLHTSTSPYSHRPPSSHRRDSSRDTYGLHSPQDAVDVVSVSVNAKASAQDEKRRKRRESHNAVERRRRDNINERIGELATLIPECMLEAANPNSSATPTGENGSVFSLPQYPLPPLGTSVATADLANLEATSPGGGPVGTKKEDTDMSSVLSLPTPTSTSFDLSLIIPPASLNPGLNTNLSSTAIPGDDLQLISPTTANGSTPTSTAAAAAGAGTQMEAGVKANKGMILAKSVEYIKYLQQLVQAQAARTRELEEALAQVRGGSNDGVSTPDAVSRQHQASTTSVANGGSMGFGSLGSSSSRRHDGRLETMPEEDMLSSMGFENGSHSSNGFDMNFDFGSDGRGGQSSAHRGGEYPTPTGSEEAMQADDVMSVRADSPAPRTPEEEAQRGRRRVRELAGVSGKDGDDVLGTSMHEKSLKEDGMEVVVSA